MKPLTPGQRQAAIDEYLEKAKQHFSVEALALLRGLLDMLK